MRLGEFLGGSWGTGSEGSGVGSATGAGASAATADSSETSGDPGSSAVVSSYGTVTLSDLTSHTSFLAKAESMERSSPRHSGHRSSMATASSPMTCA